MALTFDPLYSEMFVDLCRCKDCLQRPWWRYEKLTHFKMPIYGKIATTYPEQGYNSATVHFVWLVRSPGILYHWTFVRHLHYQRSKTCSRHICSPVPTSLTNCFQSTIVQRTLYGAFVVTLVMLLRLINCHFIIIIIINIKAFLRTHR